MSRKIATLSDYQSGGAGRNDSDSDGDSDGQNFYVGGSETSGQQVRGPPRNADPMAIIRDVFQGAQRHGAQAVQPGAQESAGRPSAFTGVGRKLDEPEVAVVAEVPGSPDRSGEVQVAIHMWRNGFSVNNGELRSYTDPAGISFLDSIKRGQIPEELQRAHRGQSLVVDLDARQDEDFVAPKRPREAFTGTGHMLGNPVPNVNFDSVENSAVKPQVTSELPKMPTDKNLPLTQIRIQMPNGSKVVTDVNLTSTVGEIRTYVIQIDASLAAREFHLITTYPRRDLNDLTATIADGKLQNAVIVVKLV